QRESHQDRQRQRHQQRAAEIDQGHDNRGDHRGIRRVAQASGVLGRDLGRFGRAVQGGGHGAGSPSSDESVAKTGNYANRRVVLSGAGSTYMSAGPFADPAMPLLRFLPEATNINFVGARYFAFAIDGLLLLASIVSIAVHGFNLGI